VPGAALERRALPQPDRIEMIVNETAKFENPDMLRRSSCAYPSSCRRRSSAVIVSAAVVSSAMIPTLCIAKAVRAYGWN
jgi:hypothetical protein